MKTAIDTSRSVGELVRGKNESIYVHPKGCMIESYQVDGFTSLTILTSYFKGMVGESIETYSYHLTKYSVKGKISTEVINTVDELRKVYNQIKGRRNRIAIWYYLKNFNGQSEDPRPYIE